MRTTRSVLAGLGVLAVIGVITLAIRIARSEMPGGRRGGWDR